MIIFMSSHFEQYNRLNQCLQQLMQEGDTDYFEIEYLRDNMNRIWQHLTDPEQQYFFIYHIGDVT